MNALKPILLALGLLGALPQFSAGAPLAKGSACAGPSGGRWAFGQAPRGCDLHAGAGVFSERYPGLVYDENASGAERARYVSSLYTYLREAADFYLGERRRYATEAERRAWRRAVMALAHQESFWSHYRQSRQDGRLKIMRGDNNFAHGLLQIDERWHPKLTMNERGEDLTAHVMYGLDVFYQGWQRAPRAACVRTEEDRVRAAYAAFNGGPRKLCRWQSKHDTWARNDHNFRKKWEAQEWLRYVRSDAGRSGVDIACLVKGGAGCADVLADPRRVATLERVPGPGAALSDSHGVAVALPSSARGKKKFALGLV